MSPGPAAPEPPSGAFVTGTDTEVGTSVVTAALAAGFAAAGLPVRALKPLASGGPPPGGDARLIGTAAGHPPLCGACFEAPAVPGRAAALEGATVDPVEIAAWVRAQLRPGTATLIDSFGGWRTPLARGWEVADLAAELGLPVVVVAANRRGVLNHAALTVSAIRGRGLALRGVVLNDAFDCPPEQAAWNRDDLRAQLPGTPVIALRRLGLPGDLAVAGAWLARRLGLIG